VTVRLRDAGQVVAAAGGLAQLAGDLPNDQGVDLAVVARERQIAAIALAELVLAVDAAQLDAIREVAMPALERAGLDAPGRAKPGDPDGTSHELGPRLGGTEIADALGRLRGDAPRRPRPVDGKDDETEDTASGKASTPIGTALSLRDAATRARAAGKLDDALATLETANHVSPGDQGVLRELVELATQTGDHEAAARHLAALAQLLTGARRGDALLELADIAYDKLEDPTRGREAMRAAATAFGSGARRDTTLRMLASEASTHLAWNIAVDALSEIAVARRSTSDFVNLATALVRAGRNVDAIAMLEEATANKQLENADELLASLRLESLRKAELATELEKRAASQATDRDAAELKAEAAELRESVGAPKPGPGLVDESPTTYRTKTGDHTDQPDEPNRPPTRGRTKTDEKWPFHSTTPGVASELRRPSRPSIPIPTDDESPDAAEAEPPAPTPLFPSPPEEVDEVVDQVELSIPIADDSTPVTPRTKTWPGTGPIEKSPALEDEAPGATEDAAVEPAPSEEPRTREPTNPPLARIKLVTRDSTRDLTRTERRPSEPPLNVQESPPKPDARSDEGGWVSVSDPNIKSGPIPVHEPTDEPTDEADRPSVVITGTLAEQASAVAMAAMAADRDRLIAAYREQPDDPALLAAVLAHLGDREPALRLELLENAALTGSGRTAAIALHELGLIAREARDPGRAQTLWARAHTLDPGYPLVWMPLADALAAGDELATARDLYERVAASEHYDATRRAFAADRAEALGRDDSVVSGTIRPKAEVLLETARTLAPEDLRGAIGLAEEAALNDGAEREALELLERLYLEAGDVTAASEAIGRQLMLDENPVHRATLWRRRAKLYRDTLGRDAEAYRCLKEAHACAPADPEISYQLRTAAMVRGEWALAASLLYREIASAPSPRDRGALHLELALIYEERLDDEPQAQVNYEQALAFDPSIPAAKLPLARRYEAIGRFADAARLYEEAATTARPAERAGLLDAATRARTAATERASENDLAAQLDRAEAMGDLDAALDLAHQLWRHEPGNAAAFRVLANVHRASGELAALTDLTAVRASRAEQPEDRATAWLEVARLAEDVGALDQAARAYDLALIEDPGHVGALDSRGALAFRLGDFATADLIYRDLGSGESVLGDDELALRRSIIAEQLGRDTEALAHGRAAAAAAPGRRDLVMRVQELATRVGDLDTALVAARSVLELIPLDDDETQLTSHFGLVELLRQAGDIEAAVVQLERILRDHPLHAPALEALAELQMARSDWAAATRYLYQLVPLAPTPAERAERLYRLGEAVLTHLGDTDRADDVFLRASDLDPTHLPTLRRLLDVYWRADDPGALVEVATELVEKNALASGPSIEPSLSRALIAAALVGDTQLTQQISAALGEAAPRRIAAALAELAGREGRLQLASASTAITELGRRGMLDLAKVRAAAVGTPVAGVLS
jgi:tetratricopeptide (TPR) repeat protein